MKKTSLALGVAAALAAAVVAYSQSQQSDMTIILKGGNMKSIALPDFRGAGGASQYVAIFNQTVYDDVQRSGQFKMAPKSFYPLNPPQQESDLRVAGTTAGRRNEPAKAADCGGRCLTDWTAAPLGADYLGFGYAAEQNGQFVAFGHFYNAATQDPSAAKLFRKLYSGALSEDGARQAGHEYASDILAQFGVASLAGSKIYFVSNRTGTKEIWEMDFDGSNQKRLTRFNSITTMPAISPDGTRLAFTTFAHGQPEIMMYSTETGRFINFMNPRAPTNAQPSFTPDGQQVLFASSISGYMQIYSASLSGANLKRISTTRAIEAEPKVNPKNASELVFVSGRGGLQQIYKMNMDGADAVRLTTGEGEASNPAWHPNGGHIAFAWTRGYEPGNWNIFVMDVVSRETLQLTHGQGRNENPTWAPDGRHIVFSSSRAGGSQIFSMLADGTQVKQLTTQGGNWMPVWSK